MGRLSFRCVIDNRTGALLKLQEDELFWGRWENRRYPLLALAAGAETLALAGVALSPATGSTSGYVVYRIDDDLQARIRIRWDVCWDGSNALQVEPAEVGIRVEVTGWTGSAAEESVVLTVHDDR
ncbi:hypothetical protein ACFWOG_39560 [Kitasatospora sp. NPDC058406]|uniref:hypothetical protein n=1 Tax=Kitasatospora sp. NPDC058406 TaxID=3346483 RepID=UPI003652674D